MDPVLVTTATINAAKEWKPGVYRVPEEMPPAVAARLVEIGHAEPFKGEAIEDKETTQNHPPPASGAPGPDPGAVSNEGLVGILDGNIAQVTGELGMLTNDELVRLAKAESDGKTRNGVMNAIAIEQEARAVAPE